MRLIMIFVLAAMACSAQQPKEPVTFSSSTQLVVETVVVTDKSGNPVVGLTPTDFVVSENGVPQTIRVFEFQDLPKAPASAVTVPADTSQVHIFDKLGNTHISPEATGSVKYKDRRLLALYFDMTAMQEGEQMRALNAAKQFIQTQMQSA